MAITVVNKHTHVPTTGDIYIGRGHNCVLGNPFSHLDSDWVPIANRCATREKAIERFREYLYRAVREKDPLICEALSGLADLCEQYDINLVCFCKPKACHGDVIREVLLKIIAARKNVVK